MSSSVTATFVFTDLVDSTATAARLGPEAAEELRQTHFRLLRGAVASSGGVEVKNLGDGLMVMYSSPSRALAGAVGMQQAIEHHNRSGGPALGVRIGISAGEAVEEEGDYFGDPVVVAARLCAVGAGGQILTADVVRALVGSHATQTFVEVGPLELKGVAGAVDAAEVVWEPASMAGSVPLPGRLIGAASDALFGFFGRGPELAALEEAGKRARSTKRCQVVLVGGEAGMGKTALVAQAARAAHGEGAIVLFGHTDEDLGVAYQPWMEALSTLVRDGDGARLVEGLPSAQQTALARLLPALSASGARVGDADTERLLLLEGAVELLAAASQEAAVLVVLDDLHWADAASLQMLRHLSAATTPMEVTVACAYRDSDLRRGDPLSKLLADLRRDANVTRIALSGLEDTEVIDLLEAAAGHGFDDRGIGLAHALRRETDGNPFFTGEMLRHLGETGGIVLGDDGRWTVTGGLEDLGLPSSVRDVVGRRVERLGLETVRVLSLAAVIGREFDVTLLATLAGMDEDALVDLVDAAVAAAVLVESAEGSRYRFAHALIQHSLYDDLSATRRQRVHHRIAEALETDLTPTDPAVLAELARHWIAATRPVELDKAVRYARLAGDAARDALAPDDAIRWYQQALDLLDRQTRPDQHSRAQLLVALGTQQSRSVQPEYRDTLTRAASLAEELGDTDTLVLAALGFSAFAGGAVGDEAAKRVMRAALDAIGADESSTRARLLAAYSEAHDFGLEWRERRDLALEAVDVARLAGDDTASVEVLTTTFLSLATPEYRDQTIADVERAVAIADRLGDPYLRCTTRFPLIWARYQHADLAGARTAIDDMATLADQLGLPNELFNVAMARTGGLLLAGHADDAEKAAEHTLELGISAGRPEALAVFGGHLYLIRQHQGRLDEMAELFIDAARDNPSIASLRATVVLLMCEIGPTGEAAERLADEARHGFEFPHDTTYLAALTDLVEAAALMRHQESARLLLERLTPFATHVLCAGPIVSGSVARPLARAATMLGNYDQAEQWFVTAHDIHQRLEAPYWTARGELDHADLCLGRRAEGDVGRARDLATAASATAAEYGCAGLSKRAAELLAEL